LEGDEIAQLLQKLGLNWDKN